MRQRQEASNPIIDQIFPLNFSKISKKFFFMKKKLRKHCANQPRQPCRPNGQRKETENGPRQDVFSIIMNGENSSKPKNICASCVSSWPPDKESIVYKRIKNMIGTFYETKRGDSTIFIFQLFLTSTSIRLLFDFYAKRQRIWYTRTHAHK